MNHDYAHCLDFKKDCPKDCFRAELAKDLDKHKADYIGKPLDYMHLKGTKECKRGDTDVN